MLEADKSPHPLRIVMQRQGTFLAYSLCVILLCVAILPYVVLAFSFPDSDNKLVGVLPEILHIVLVGIAFFLAGRFIVRRNERIMFALLFGLFVSFIYGVCAYTIIGMLASWNEYTRCVGPCAYVAYIPFWPAEVRVAILVEALFLGWLMSWLGGWIEMSRLKGREA